MRLLFPSFSFRSLHIWRLLSAAAVVMALASAAHAEVLASSSFDTNPAPADPRLTLNGDSTLTAQYNTLLETDKILFPLTHHLTAADSFTITTRFKILSTNFFADPNGFAQIGFGLVNSVTTGPDRSTSFTTNGDTFDMIGFDYYPNVNSFPSPSLSPTIFSSRTGTEDAIPGHLHTVFYSESALNDPGESGLPLDTFINSTLAYDATTRRATLSLTTSAGPLFLNFGGGFDGDTSTIQLDFPVGKNFDVDSYALTLWKDSWAGPDPSVRADMVFDSFSVSTPEPASLSVMVGALLLIRRRRAAR